MPGEVVALNETGIFVQAGPQTIFVSKHLMSSDVRYDPESTPPCFFSEQDETKIVKGSLMLVKIVGMRKAANEIVLVGSINEDYLGLVEA